MRIRLASVVWLTAIYCVGCRQAPTPSPVGTASGVEIHYSPAENLELFDGRAFESATSTIDLCAYSFTDRVLAQALEEAARRGVQVRVYLDRGQSSGELNHENRLGESGIDDPADGERIATEGVLRSLASAPNVKVLVKHSKTLMHLKSYLVDGTLLRSGSANFTATGEKRQDNDLSFTRDSASIRGFKTNFNLIWNRSDNAGLDVSR